ncbi:ectoine/hydroxyectoine ABC transporter substrate-binding protein EhuB [Streptomyces sp. TRM43335]|uniref:Ectoine/hydroxyectoine ABC transporter substrate-binding protein EhuB n=1 Tax=Streptomyces taklimakanensis TaxID=2569853 RepID=A0A6G2BBC0_9ACTN|nr:ectoine/hydroxyectoine ABC transporter substrate-binding protein EhuB [Streptomyces taklimakanensis]MTE19192.1 ectoine/hydroxyectoine ABC transporter substrate-binding protein EhuB [Streptomyces taklimakanensis]
MAPPQRNEREKTDIHESPSNRNRSFGGISRRSLLAGLGAVGAAGVMGAAAGCSRVPEVGEGHESLLKRLRGQGTVRVGIAGEVPYGYINKQGELTGEAPEIAKVIFKRLGVENVVPVPTEFGSLIPGLRSQQFDVVSAGMYITPERCEQVIFSDPEYVMLDAFIVRKGNPKGLYTYQDIVEKNARMASGTAYAEIDYAVANGVPRDDILILPDQVAGLAAVEQGRVDVFAGTSLTVRQVVEGSNRAEATEPFQPVVDGEPAVGAGGFAFRPTSTDLRDAFNRELRKLKQSGELLEIVKPFGFTEDEMTDLTAKELCAS